MPTEADWKAHLETKAKDLDVVRTVNVNFLRQAAVHSSQLTGHPAWDQYLQKLQVILEDTQKEIAVIHENLASPMEESKVRLCYVALNVLAERARTLQTCMSLPKEIITHAAEHGLVTGQHA